MSFYKQKIYFHLPGLFDFYEFYKVFLPLFYEHREYFYDFCEIKSIYGAPYGCLWGGGRIESGETNPHSVIKLLEQYNISPRLTFSNSLLETCHLSDRKCNDLCKLFNETKIQTGIIIYSDLLLDYLKSKFQNFYFISSTTKVITDFSEFVKELNVKDFDYVVPDFRLNKDFTDLNKLSESQKNKVEFLCNECCWFECKERKNCYKNVSQKSLDADCKDHICTAPGGNKGYSFVKAKKNPGFISIHDIQNIYIPNGFSNFKIEGRGLGSAMLLEFILYYMTKPDFHLNVREALYLDSMLDLF